MTSNLKINETAAVELGRDIGTKTVDLTNLTAEDLGFVFEYGLTQWINDGGSNAKQPGAAGVLARLERVEAGNISAGQSRVRVPAHIVEARKIVARELVAKGKAKNATVAGKMAREDLKGSHAMISKKNHDKFLDGCRARIESEGDLL